jgi:putative CocE/NonD family hydrolase
MTVSAELRPWRTDTADGMVIEWDLGIPLDDGMVLRADAFRPDAPGRYPVILSYGPYAKGLPFQEGYPEQWRRLIEGHPEVVGGSSGRYQNWEVADPEKWVPDGYVCLRVDSRGAGRSPGLLDPFSPREARDFYLCIEWAGERTWSNGKVGLLGISYYAINQWQVASLQPPHLAAMCAWEGAADWYRDMVSEIGPMRDPLVVGPSILVNVGIRCQLPVRTTVIGRATHIPLAMSLGHALPRFGHPVPLEHLRPHPIMVRFRDCCSVSMPRP